MNINLINKRYWHFIVSLISLTTGLTTFDAFLDNVSVYAGSCSFNSVVGVVFGSYDVFNPASTDSLGSFTYNCTELSPGSIIIDLSRGNSSTYTPRTMTQQSDVLNYNLYIDAARTVIWGDGTNGTSHYGPTYPSNSTNIPIYIYGRIPAGQRNAKAGNYADTINVTITF